ncbi:MAG: stage 0 sporulation family protein [Firmicutes bacterium]|nr:stage 0 sporulation family protein [Bacillota bacterium]
MAKVAGVHFKQAGRVYYFDPGEFDPKLGQNVIVETARGIEFGSIAAEVHEVAESEIVAPLKPIIRLATEEDEAKHRANEEKKAKALDICQEKIEKHGLDMKLVDVEYIFDGTKVIFYFTSDGRVDFRELVKDLASVFRMKIELRQIGVRDETKMMGGIGCCGRELCCHAWLPDFEPVSIKMAKVQNLSLNPIKISGICGRLMCCLQYENDVYVDLRKGMPDVGEHITTRDGEAIVFDVNILEDRIKTRLVLEEKSEDKPEKLSSEYYFYSKSEIERRDRKKAHQEQSSKKKGKKRAQASDENIALMSEEELNELAEEEQNN